MRFASVSTVSLVSLFSCLGCGSGGLVVQGYANVDLNGNDTGFSFATDRSLIDLEGRRPGDPRFAGECHLYEDSTGATIVRPDDGTPGAPLQEIQIESGFGVMEVSVRLGDETFTAVGNGGSCIVSAVYGGRHSVVFEVDCTVTSETDGVTTALVEAELDFAGCDGSWRP